MKILAVRSIPLSAQTKAAWKTAGVVFASRQRYGNEIMGLPFDLVINLGDSNFNPDDTERVINLGATIKDLITPGGTRRMFGDLLPPEPTSYPCDVWTKGPGRGGHNKVKERLESARNTGRRGWDTQVHIEGKEYRIITVNRRVVQQHRRSSSAPSNVRHRTYRWERKQDTPPSVNKLAKMAASLLRTPTIIGWDIILPTDSGQPFLLEGNSCPGLNEATARRIVTELERNYNAES